MVYVFTHITTVNKDLLQRLEESFELYDQYNTFRYEQNNGMYSMRIDGDQVGTAIEQARRYDGTTFIAMANDICDSTTLELRVDENSENRIKEADIDYMSKFKINRLSHMQNQHELE